ncbi:MAG: DMT family transporter [Actinomycetales bacterium]|nr:DMT family transporter [Actinomycetales bacterium]
MSRRGWLLFATMAVLWGIPYLLIRVAVRQLDPGVLVFGRTGPASLLLLPLVIARGQFRAIVRNFGWIVVFAFVEFGVPWYFMATAEQHITSSLTSLLICAVPLFSVVAQRFRRTEEHISRRRLLGLGVGALGVALLVGLGIHGGSVGWIGLMLLVAIGYTLGPILLATKLADVPGIAVVAGATGVVALAWLPWSILHWPHHVDHETWESVAILAVACTAAAFVTFFELVQEVGSTRSVVVTYVNTALAVVLGVVFLSEPITTGILIGFPLVLVGSVIATSRGSSAEKVTSDADELIHG